jgi:signal transduction histidine kinase/CheY-like chemotaxis protein
MIPRPKPTEVDAALIRSLFGQGTLSMATQAVIGVVFAYILWPSARPGTMLAWLALQWLLVAVRSSHIWLFNRRRPSAEEVSRWAAESVGLSLLFGLVWGSTCFLFLDPTTPLSLIVIVMLMIGLTAGAAVMLGSYLPSFFAFASPCMLGLIAALLWHGDRLSNVVAGLAAVSFVMTSASCLHFHRTLRSSLQLGLDLKHREAALDAAREAAERANAAKTRFLAAASHDLRQPIQALWLFFGTLSARVRNAETGPLLDQIEDSIGATDSILNSLLDISKLDAGVVQPSLRSVALGPLLARLSTEFQPLAKERGNRLRIRSSRANVRSDAGMLERILRNLITNALRYTENGRVLVGVRPRGNRLRIEVHDTGPGIPADQFENIFLEFHQLGNPERDRHQGLGLGLAIVKRMADLMGQSVTVRSTVGRGSCFALNVPVSSELPEFAESVGSRQPGSELRGRRVFALDDDAAVLDSMRLLLEAWGCDVTTARSADEALARIRAAERKPEFLIVDYRLPGHASGLVTAAQISEAVGEDLPTIIVTGDTAPDRLREAQESGYLLLHKPVQPARLRTTLRQLANKRELPSG